MATVTASGERTPTGLRRTVGAAVAAVAVVALAGCTAGAPQASVVTAQSPAGDTVRFRQGSVTAAVHGLPGVITKVMKQSGVPGMAVAVVHDGKTVFARGYGVRRVGSPAAVDTHTVFQIASLSKPIAGTVVADEVGKKVVSWDTPVHRELPAFTLADPYVTDHVTVGDLFAHRSGLPHAAGDLLEDIGYGRSYILSHLHDEPLSPFRASYAYANFGLTAGAEAVAAAAGTDWADLAQRDLYGPLGMTSTSSRYANFTTRGDRASLHALVDGTFRPLYRRDADAQSPAGGVSSDVVDLAAWMDLILADGEHDGVRLIPQDALNPALRDQSVSAPAASPRDRSSAYGYGFNVGVTASGQPMLSHSGAFALGAGTSVVMLPRLDTGIVVLTNGAPVGAAEAVTASFADLLQYGRVTRDWYAGYHPLLASQIAPAGDLVGKKPPASPAPAADIAAYTGTYHNPYYGTATVTDHDGALVVALGPAGDYRLTLHHWDGDTFAFTPSGENAPAGSRSSATFRMSGPAAGAMTLAFFDDDGLGTWTR